MCAGDEQYATSTSLVGSIGVISANFGFVEAMKRLGLERRVYTAGEAKDLLDPFRQSRPHSCPTFHGSHNMRLVVLIAGHWQSIYGLQ